MRMSSDYAVVFSSTSFLRTAVSFVIGIGSIRTIYCYTMSKFVFVEDFGVPWSPELILQQYLYFLAEWKTVCKIT